MDVLRYPVGGVGNRPVGQMDVALRGFDQRMAEQLGDGHHANTVHRGDRSPAVSEVVKPQTGQTCSLPMRSQ